jgi:hypothetical protein
VRTASQLADEIASDVLPPLPDSRWLSSRVSEQPCGLDQQHHGRDQIEHGELNLGEELNSRSAHEAHDQRADERALQAPETGDPCRGTLFLGAHASTWASSCTA